jgi:hypothetical protein
MFSFIHRLFSEKEATSGGRHDNEEVRSPEWWNKWWANHAGESLPIYSLAFQLREHFDSTPVSRVLFAGNGVSVEPHDFVAMGAEVTVLDISDVAISRSRKNCVSPKAREHRYDTYIDGKLVERCVWTPPHRAGGAIRFVQGDIADASVESGPFDLIVCRKVLQYYSHEALDRMCDGLVSRMASQSLLVVEFMNAAASSTATCEFLGRRGVTRYDWKAAGGAGREALLINGSG